LARHGKVPRDELLQRLFDIRLLTIHDVPGEMDSYSVSALRATARRFGMVRWSKGPPARGCRDFIEPSLRIMRKNWGFHSIEPPNLATAAELK
jgi:hypothetical protein